jgi:type VI secretion system Hcp family effector
MSLNAFMKIGSAEGEARQGKYGKQKWIELQSWEWEVEAETSWTKGGGASVGKPNPGKLSWEHYFDRSSHLLLGYICTGSAFDKCHLEMCKGTGAKAGEPEMFFSITMEEAFITKVSQNATEDGNVIQKVEMVFKKISIDYRAQGLPWAASPGALAAPVNFWWDIPGGKAGPSTGA